MSRSSATGAKTWAIGVFAKPPTLGSTKTRLAQSIGDEAACELHRCFVHDTIATTSALAPTTVFSASDHDSIFFRELSASFGVQLLPQCNGDLGQRMAEAMGLLLQSHTCAVIVGSDAPAMPKGVLREAAQEKIAFAPSADGGFYLVSGCKVPSFEGVQWSVRSTLRQTLERNAGATVLQPWFDVDTIDDLHHLRTMLSLDPTRAPRSAAWLRREPESRS